MRSWLLLSVNVGLLIYNFLLIRVWFRLAARVEAIREEAAKTNAETKDLLASLANRIPPRGES